MVHRLHISNWRNEADAVISATTQFKGLAAMTRDIMDFEESTVDIVDPWLG